MVSLLYNGNLAQPNRYFVQSNLTSVVAIALALYNQCNKKIIVMFVI